MIDHTLPEADPAARFNGAALPLSGISHRPTVQLCNETGMIPVYQSDRYGFDNPDAVWDSTRATLLLIGDSFVHGYCVGEDRTLAARLRAHFPRTINLGTGGSGPLSELATLTEYQSIARPEIVLWFYHENDFRDLAGERRHATLTRYLESGFSQNLARRQAEMDSALLPWVDSLYFRGFAAEDVRGRRWRRLLTLHSLRTLIVSLGRRTDYSDEQTLFRQVMQTASRRAAAGGSTFVFVFLPRWERWFQPRASEVDLRDSVLAAVTPLGIQVIDLTTVFDSVTDKASLFGRGDLLRAHYSPRGYQLVADVIARAVDSLGLRP